MPESSRVDAESSKPQSRESAEESTELQEMAVESIPRRRFLTLALAGAATAGVGAKTLRAQQPQAKESPASSPYALVIDATKCRGCGACAEACRLKNEGTTGDSCIRILRRDTDPVMSFLPVQCQHCASPPCATVCPTNATYVRPDGVVIVNTKLCVGCKYCMTACPYQARIFDEERGVVDKCWLCLDRVLEGQPPACVEACIMGARIFGRTDDPDSEVSQLISSGRAKPLHPEFDTRPAVLSYIIEE